MVSGALVVGVGSVVGAGSVVSGALVVGVGSVVGGGSVVVGAAAVVVVGACVVGAVVGALASFVPSLPQAAATDATMARAVIRRLCFMDMPPRDSAM